MAEENHAAEDAAGTGAASVADTGALTVAETGAMGKAETGAMGKAETGAVSIADTPAADPGATTDRGRTADRAVAEAPGDDRDGPVAWPEDWRQRMAGDNEKALKRLARYKSPETVLKAFLAADAKINSGRVHGPFPDDGSDEDQATWRKANGVPDTWQGYHDTLDGIVVGEDDQALVDDFLATAHANSERPESVRTAVEWYFKTQERVAADRAAADLVFRGDAVETLREQMGPHYERNMQDLKNWLAMGPSGSEGAPPFDELLCGGRLADGSLLGDNPRVLGFLTGAMREINPLSTVVPSTGADALRTIDDEIAAIEQDIQSDRKAYHADTAKRARYGELLAARDRARGRGAR